MSSKKEKPNGILPAFYFQNSRLSREHADSVLNAEREMWAQEKEEFQQALSAAQAELSRVREELSKEPAAFVPVSGHESDTDETTWPRAKVGWCFCKDRDQSSGQLLLYSRI